VSAAYKLEARCSDGFLLVGRVRFIAEGALREINEAGTFENKRHAELEIERKLRNGGCPHVKGIRLVPTKAEMAP
jgi:hypothetical protein